MVGDAKLPHCFSSLPRAPLLPCLVTYLAFLLRCVASCLRALNWCAYSTSSKQHKDVPSGKQAVIFAEDPPWYPCLSPNQRTGRQRAKAAAQKLRWLMRTSIHLDSRAADSRIRTFAVAAISDPSANALDTQHEIQHYSLLSLHSEPIFAYVAIMLVDGTG